MLQYLFALSRLKGLEWLEDQTASLQDIPSAHVESLLTYMYSGEVSIQENDLVNLLHSAKGLGVKGLCDVDNVSSLIYFDA